MIQKILSPCISICEITAKNGFCKGCFRTKIEIENWTRYDYQQQCDLLVKLRKRKFLNTGKIRRKNKRNIL